MSSVRARPRWFFLITPRWLGWHAFAVLAAFGMLWLGEWQFHRAGSGNAPSWAKTIRDEFKPHTDPGDAPEVELPVGAGASAAVGAGVGAGGPGARVTEEEDEDDPELAAYNAYLARLNDQVKGHGKWHGLR